MTIESVCIFSGASNTVPRHYIEEAARVGRAVAEHKLKLIYGGGDCGLMGAAADACLAENGYVIGVFPTVLQGLEVEHKGLSEHYVLGTMHARKQLMFDKADSFLILPGGFGTMDETFEVITWRQLHMHEKPVVIYNYNGYWDKWLAMVEHFYREGFAGEYTRQTYSVAHSMEEAFKLLGAEK